MRSTENRRNKALLNEVIFSNYIMRYSWLVVKILVHNLPGLGSLG